MLTFTYRVIIDRFIKAPGRCIIKIYGINGYAKSYFRQKMLIMGTEEGNY